MGQSWQWLLVLQAAVIASLIFSYKSWKSVAGQQLVYERDSWILKADNLSSVDVDLIQWYQMGCLWIVVFRCRDKNKKIAIPLLPDSVLPDSVLHDSGQANELRRFKQLLLLADLTSN
jgi:hypothetical protein